MKLQTQISLEKKSENLIDYNSNVLLLGSCFVENIGDKLSYFKFKNLQNPIGILFQPNAIETLIINAIQNKEYSENDIFFQNEQWHCFDAHSKLSSTSKANLLSNLNQESKLTNQQIQEASHVIITLGTAWAYRFLESNKLVANCHKVPQKQFKKELLSVEEIVKSINSIFSLISTVNTKATFIFTVSPVRHLKDGFIENTQSKAHLIAAIHQVINNQLSFNNTKIAYFPSYEIMMDELRDYRFYAEDMIHPNQTAINYIWEKFQEVWISKETYKIMDEVDAIQKGLKHKAFNINSNSHQKFISEIKDKQTKLQNNFPQIVF